MRVRFRGIDHRELILVKGPKGWGEFGPFPEYPDEVCVPWLRSALEVGWQGLPSALRDMVPVNATVPAVDVRAHTHAVGELLARFPGCLTIKIKVCEPGQTLEDDIARVTAVHRERPQAVIRVDANGGWDQQTAFAASVAFVDALREPEYLEYLEQPCAQVHELVSLRQELRRHFGDNAPWVAADESIRRASDPLKVVREGGADSVVVKTARLGGPSRVIQFAREAALPVVVSSALDSVVGIGASLVTAASLPGNYRTPLDHRKRADSGGIQQPADMLPGRQRKKQAEGRRTRTSLLACGLGTGQLFIEDVAPGLQIIDGQLPARATVPELERITALEPSPNRCNWWITRLRRVYELSLI